MDITSIGNLSNLSSDFKLGLDSVRQKNKNETFENMFQSALSTLNETNSLSNAAEEEEIKYAMGYSNSTHDLQVAQQKANLSLQYTVAIRNKLLDAYKEIMNLQF